MTSLYSISFGRVLHGCDHLLRDMVQPASFSIGTLDLSLMVWSTSMMDRSCMR
jgi:hypothetical protein